MWIETSVNLNSPNVNLVTPHTGVWIETVSAGAKNSVTSVTPHTGVWIETYPDIVTDNGVERHAPHGRVD